MATSTYMTFLMHKKGDTYEKLIDITSFPDLGGSPELIDVTTLSHGMQINIPGIQQLSGLEFETNYEPDGFEALDALALKEESYAVWFGGTESAGVVTPTGSLGKFEFDGQLSVYVKGGGVNEARKMGITIAASSEIVFKNA